MRSLRVIALTLLSLWGASAAAQDYGIPSPREDQAVPTLEELVPDVGTELPELDILKEEPSADRYPGVDDILNAMREIPKLDLPKNTPVRED